MLDIVKELNQRYSIALKKYERTLPNSKSLPKLLESFQSEKYIKFKKEKEREKEKTQRNRVFFFQNFGKISRDPLSINALANSMSTSKIKANALSKIGNNSKFLNSSSSKVYALTEESNEYIDIFSTDYSRIKDKPKSKPKKIFKLKLGKQQKFDIRNYSPNHSFVLKRILAVKINPLPKKLPMLNLKKKLLMSERNCFNK